MSNGTKLAIGGVAAFVILWWILPTWAALIMLAVVVGVPVVGYLMLDDSQRRRLRRIRQRQIGR